MLILGIESSCDECAAALVEDGQRILSSVVATQIPFHEKFQGVVPEIASRKHLEWISGVVRRALEEGHAELGDIDGVAATAKPGLVGSLLVGLSFGKSMAYALEKPFVGVNHILAHLYAPQLEEPIPYPYLGLLVSGGHSMICRVEDFDRIEVIGTTIDDAVGEAFDKVAKHYGFGYPGGLAIDRLAQTGDSSAFSFPRPSLHKGEHRYDVSYSGLKTAVIHQLEQYRRQGAEASPENIAASFQKAAIDILLSRLFKAVEDTGLRTVVAGGGVAANSYLRRALAEKTGGPGKGIGEQEGAQNRSPRGRESRWNLNVRFPPLSLCGDNGAMVAGIGARYLERGEASGLELSVSARVPLYRRLSR